KDLARRQRVVDDRHRLAIVPNRAVRGGKTLRDLRGDEEGEIEGHPPIPRRVLFVERRERNPVDELPDEQRLSVPAAVVVCTRDIRMLHGGATLGGADERSLDLGRLVRRDARE